MPTRQLSVRPVMTGGIAALISATALAPPVAAQGEAPSLCTMFDIDALSAATGQEYESEPQRDLPEMCRWATTSDPNHGLTLAFDPQVPYRRLREQAGEFEDLEVARMPAFVTSDTIDAMNRHDEIVYVDMDGALALYVALRGGIDEIPDQREQAIALAEAVATAHPGPTFSIPDLAPPPLEDVIWSEQGFRSGQGEAVAEFMGDALDPLLEALGVDYSGVSLLAAQSNLDDGSEYRFLGFLRSIRIEGVEQAAIAKPH